MFRPKKCCILGICICEQPGLAANHFKNKLTAQLRKIFTPKSMGRSRLDSCLTVLRFDCGDDSMYFHLGYCNLKTYHFTMLQMKANGPTIQHKGLPLQPLCLMDYEGENPTTVKLAIHQFCEFDLQEMWTCRVGYIVPTSVKFFDIASMQPQHVDAYFDEDHADFLWQGWEHEKPVRAGSKRKRSGPKKPKDVGKPKGSGSARPASKHRKVPNPPEAPYDDMDYDDIDDKDNDSDSPSQHLSDSEFDNGEDAMASSDSANEDGDDDDGDGMHQEWRQKVGDDLDIAALFASDSEDGVVASATADAEAPLPPPDFAPPPDSAIPPSSPIADTVTKSLQHQFDAAASAGGDPSRPGVGGDSDTDKIEHGAAGSDAKAQAEPELEDKDDESINTSDVSISSLEVASESDSSSSSSGSPPRPASSKAKPQPSKKKVAKKDDEVDEVSAAAPKAAKAAADDRMDYTNGSLRYNFRSQNIVAHCSYHIGSNCRRTRTAKPPAGKSTGLTSQGRPVGLLAAWLEQAQNFASAKEHSAQCRPSYAERLEARRNFESLSGGLDWANSFERPAKDGEEREPRDFC